MRLSKRFHLLTGAVLSAAVCATACGRNEAEAPPAAAQTEVSRQPNTPTTVTGCLRAGEAASTFVLTTTATADASAPTTYHLTGADNVKLQDHIGRRVEVSGTVETQSQIATREAPRTADNATGTAGAPGTPTVQTSTQLNVQRLQVTNVRSTGEACADNR